jgi:hypothetical protein
MSWADGIAVYGLGDLWKIKNEFLKIISTQRIIYSVQYSQFQWLIGNLFTHLYMLSAGA